MFWIQPQFWTRDHTFHINLTSSLRKRIRFNSYHCVFNQILSNLSFFTLTEDIVLRLCSTYLKVKIHILKENIFLLNLDNSLLSYPGLLNTGRGRGGVSGSVLLLIKNIELDLGELEHSYIWTLFWTENIWNVVITKLERGGGGGGDFKYEFWTRYLLGV